MIPETAREMVLRIQLSLLTRAYGDATTAARRKGVSENALRQIEGDAIAIFNAGADFATEFETFQAEIAVADALRGFTQICEHVREGRVKNLEKRR